ncbi:MAG: Cna B-type domain-containing protein [Clostridiaceae bacterium]|nr:Cna B-type domain-containing protein [Clostridiaceae bacterium]
MGANPGGEYRTSVVNQGVDTGVDPDKLYTGAVLNNVLEKNMWATFYTKWEDEGADKDNRPKPTVYLYRVAEPGTNQAVDFGQLHPVAGYDNAPVPTDEDEAIIRFGYEDGTEGKLPLYNANGQRYIYYAIVNIPGAGDYVQLIKNTTGNYSDQAMQEADKEGYLLCMGTLTLRRQAKVSLTASKTFVAASMQDINNMENVSVTLMLQKSENGRTDWKNVTDDEGALVTRNLEGFRGEQLSITSEEPYEAPKYNEKGAEIKYRWVEISMTMKDQSSTVEKNGDYFADESIQTPAGADGTINQVGPGAGGVNSAAHFRVIYNEDGSVTNRLMGNTEMIVTKTWADTGWGTGKNMTLQQWLDSEEGAAYKNQTISFRLNRNDGKSSISAGAEGTENTLYGYSYNENGTLVRNDPIRDITIHVGENLSAEDARNIWKNLQRYDEDGSEYIYSVEEINNDGSGAKLWNSSKTYTREVVFDHNDYYVRKKAAFVNSPNGGQMYFQAGKIWLDHGDLLCRKPVQAALYHKDTTTKQWLKVEKIGENGSNTVTLDDKNNWFTEFSITPVNGDTDYSHYLIVEEKIGENGTVNYSGHLDEIAKRSKVVPMYDNGEEDYKNFFGGTKDESAEQVQEKLQAAVAGHIEGNTTGLRHNYNVYLSANGEGRYFIYNQRTGTVNVDIKKTWKTGSNQNEEESSVLAITQNGNPIVWLKLDKQKQTGMLGLVDKGYFNSWSSANNGPVLTSGSTNTGIPQDKLNSFHTSTLYQSGNYPKYDGMGRLYRYGIEEEAILLRKADTEDYYTVTKVDQSKKKGTKVLATVETTDESNKKIYHNYTISQSSSVKYADQPDVSDQYSFSVTNAREQMLTLTADKVWQDDGSRAADATEKRPDISFYLYRTTKYKSADALLQAFNHAIGSQQDPTNIPRETIEAAQQRLINQSEIVKINGNGKFQWNTKQNDWYWISSRFTENERYDENGDPYIYFLVEKIPHSGSGVYNGEYHTRYNNAHIGSQVGSETITTDNANTKRFSAQAVSDAASTEEVYEPNYLDEQYQATLSPGLLIVSDGIHSVPVKTTYVNGVQSNEIVAEGTEGAVQNYNSYWAHTVINYRVDQDKISGRKIWQLPGGEKLDENYLPDVTFRLRRQSGKGTSVAVNASDFRKNWSSDTVGNGALYVTLGQNKKTNAAAAEKVNITGTNHYAYTIFDLPVYDKYGQKYLYSVKEDNLDNITYFKMGDHPADSAVSFVNYYTGDPKARLSFTKEWSVGTPPAGSSFSLDPEKGTITVTTNEKTTVTSLPKSLTFQIQGYFTGADGKKGAEIASASYTAIVKADYQESNYTLSGTIKCNGGDQTSGDTAPKMKVTIASASTGNAKAVWKVELSNLKSLAPDGNPILYEVTETVPDGYDGTSTGKTVLESSTTGSQTPTYSGQAFQNAYTGKKTGGSYTSITVQKKWDDMGYDRKLESITLTLYRKNVKEADDPNQDVVIESNLILSADNSWKAVVGKGADGSPTLPVYAPDGQPYAYYVTEIQENSSYQLTGSQTQYGTDGATVTATNVLPRGRISFKKSWQTQTDGQEPKPLTSPSDFDRLLNLGALPKVTFTIQYLDNSNNWQDLKLKGNTVSTTFDPRTNPDHYRNNLFTGQNYYTVPLYREGTNSPGNNNENYQQYRIKETIQHADGTTEDHYSENIIAGNTQTDDTTASITNTVQVVQVEILKKWEDNHDRDGRRPEQLSTYLKAQNSDGKWKKMEEMAVLPDDATITTLTEDERNTGDTYTTGVMLLPKAHASLAITEAEVGGYSPAEQNPVSGSRTLSDGTSVATYTFTNTCVPKLFHISAEKMWNDEENKYGLRNENGSVDLTLWYRLGDTGNWNKVTTAPVAIRKYYTVNGEQKLYYDDSTSVYTTTLLKEDSSLTCTSGTTAVWENLPANAMVNGSTVEVQYKITESGANKAYTGMISSTDGSAFDGTIQFKGTDGETQHFKITNTLQTTSLTIHKEWKQEDQVADGESYRPDEITFQVEYRAKTEQTWKDLPGGRVTMTKPAGTDSWTKTLTGLPVCDQNGNEYEYRVSEISLTYKKLLGIISNTDQVTGSFHTEEDGTETWTGDAGRYLVTVTTEKNADGSFTASAENALIDRYHQFSVEVSKQWEDGDNRFGLRPDHNGAVLKLQYSLDGGTTWADITKAELNWDNCYEDNHGVYTTSEPQQTAIAVSADTKGSPARWEHLPAKVLVGNTSVEVQYRVTEPDHSAAYTDQLYRAAADGSFDASVNYDDCILWKGTDKEIQKFVIVNTMETVSLSISKNWDGEDAVTDSEALRPEQIDFKVEYTVSGSDDWKSLPAGIYETETAGEAVTVSEGGLVSVHAPEWKMTLQGLAKTDGTGAAYQYRVSEAVLHYADTEAATVSDGEFSVQEDGSIFWSADTGRYEAELTIRQDADGNISVHALNTLIDRYKFVTVEATKEWQDNENQFTLRPAQNAAEVTLWYSTDDGANWKEIREGSLEVGGYYADNKAVYTTSKARQTAAPGCPARWENLPGKVLVNGRSHLVQYQVREADYPAYEATIGPEQITWEEAEGEVRTVQVKNIMKTTSLFIQKNWSDENGVKNARALRPEQVEVKLEYAAGNATDWKALPSGTYQTTEGKEVRVDSEGLLLLSEKDGWKQTLTGLPVCNADGQIFHYRVTETRLLYKGGQIYTVKNGDAGRYQVSETTVQDADGTWKAVLTNQLVDRYQARITKHAETLDGPVLEGAGYVLYRPEQMDYYTGQDASGNATWGIWNDAKILYTGSDGTTMISGLPRGSYQFVEVAAAKGYRIDSTPIDFTIGDDNIGTICEVHQADLKRTGGHRHRDTSEKTISGTAATEIKPVGPPRTGDDNDWRIYAGMSVGLLAVIAVLLRKLKNH